MRTWVGYPFAIVGRSIGSKSNLNQTRQGSTDCDDVTDDSVCLSVTHIGSVLTQVELVRTGTQYLNDAAVRMHACTDTISVPGAYLT